VPDHPGPRQRARARPPQPVPGRADRGPAPAGAGRPARRRLADRRRAGRAPLDEARFPPGSLLRGLHDAAREALARDPLVPAEGGGWARAGDLALTPDPALHALLATLAG